MEELINQKKSLPDTLKVLCILTFIGCAFVIGSTVYNYVTIDKQVIEMESKMQKVEETGNTMVIGIMQDAQAALINAQQNKTASLIVGVLAALLCLGGAIMMWNLKKNGFFVYTIGEFTPTIFTFLVLGIGKGTFGILSSGFLVIIPLVFIILYATQLKHMD